MNAQPRALNTVPFVSVENMMNLVRDIGVERFMTELSLYKVKGYDALEKAVRDYAAANPERRLLIAQQADYKAQMDLVLGRIGQIIPSPEQHSTQLIVGDVANKRWSKIRPDAPAAAIAQRLQLLTMPVAGR